MTFSFPVTLALAAIIPIVLGSIWYNPKVFGKAWLAAIGKTPEDMKGANMALTLGLAYILSFFLAFALNYIVIHQWHVYSMLMDQQATMADHTSQLSMTVSDLMAKHGHSFRTFKHGAFHGTLAGITFALPIVATQGLFERRGFKYIAINAGYWIITCAAMGAFICHFQTTVYGH